MTETEGRRRVCEVAREWIRTPYHHRARVKGAGVDCAQLIAAVYVEAGVVESVPLDDYPADWMMHRSEERLRRTIEMYMRKVDRPARDGDTLLFQWGRCVSHAGIVVGWPLIVHAWINRGVVLSDYSVEADLGKRLRGVWTPKGWD